MIKHYFFMIITLFVASSTIKAEVGCRDNSYHTHGFLDTKTYKPVQCNCDCSKQKQLADKNTCTKCGHVHYSLEKVFCNYTKGN